MMTLMERALVKLEQRRRIQENYNEDFERIDIHGFARDLWFQWLFDHNNADFLHHLSDPKIKSCKDDLFDHMMKPFYILPFYILNDMQREDG